MRILIAIDLNDDDLTEAYNADPRVTYIDDDDLLGSVAARVEEFYCGGQNKPVKGRLVAMGDFTDALSELLDAAEVGADGIADEYKRGHIHGSLVTMRQLLENEDEA